MSNIFLSFLSVVFFVISIYLYKKPDKFVFTMFFYFILVIGSLLLFITFGVSDYFTGNGIDEATIYHLKYGLEGAGFLEYKELIIFTMFLLTLGFGLLLWYLLKKRTTTKNKNIIAYIIMVISVLFNPASIDIYKALNVDYSISDEFYKFYRKPYIKQIGKNTKNLVFIYAESLEHTYFYQSIFPGLIKHLRKLELKSTSFTRIFQVPNNGYTIAGIVNSQLGIPLVTPSFGNSMSGMDQFLPSAIGLGDLLNEQGYYLSFLGGADLNFAGKGKFFKTHGFHEVLGRDELLFKLQDKTYLNGWGLYDDTLLNIVFDRFIELSKTKDKFGLFTLTLDTHHPNGHISKSCEGIEYKEGSNPILNAVACSDYLIADFVNKIIRSEYANKTIIVLVSDHLALRNTASDLLKTKIRIPGKKTEPRRRNLFMIIDPSKMKGINVGTFGTNIDIGPTILPFIGFSGEIGLGRNLLQDIKPGVPITANVLKNKDKWKRLGEEIRRIRRKQKDWRGSIIKFWDFPRIKSSVSINTSDETIKLDNRKFKIPILIELNENLESVLKFQFNMNNKSQTLLEQINLIDKDKWFLLVDKGKNIKTIDKNLNNESYYLMIGKGKEHLQIIKLDTINNYTAKNIQQMIKLNYKLNLY